MVTLTTPKIVCSLCDCPKSDEPACCLVCEQRTACLVPCRVIVFGETKCDMQREV